MLQRYYTRSEAARYLGLRTTEGVRHLEQKGILNPVRDERGYLLFDPKELKKVKTHRDSVGMPPKLTKSELKEERLQRKKARAAQSEEDRIYREAAAEWNKQRAESQLWYKAWDEVHACNKVAREAFEQHHVDAYGAMRILEIEMGELRQIVTDGQLREVLESPRQLTVRGGIGSDNPPYIAESTSTVLYGGPYYAHADLLELRRKWVEREVPWPKSWKQSRRRHELEPEEQFGVERVHRGSQVIDGSREIGVDGRIGGVAFAPCPFGWTPVDRV